MASSFKCQNILCKARTIFRYVVYTNIMPHPIVWFTHTHLTMWFTHTPVCGSHTPHCVVHTPPPLCGLHKHSIPPTPILSPLVSWQTLGCLTLAVVMVLRSRGANKCLLCSSAGQSRQQHAPWNFLYGDFCEEQDRKTGSDIQVMCSSLQRPWAVPLTVVRVKSHWT